MSETVLYECTVTSQFEASWMGCGRTFTSRAMRRKHVEAFRARVRRHQRRCSGCKAWSKWFAAQRDPNAPTPQLFDVNAYDPIRDAGAMTIPVGDE